MTVLWYSSTGNTLALARLIASQTADSRLLPLLSVPNGAVVDDPEVVCVAVPVMCGRVAPAAAEALRRITVRSPHIAAVATFGYTPGIALSQLAELLPDATYVVGVKAPDSCLTVRNPLKGKARLGSLDLPGRVRQILSAISNGEERQAKASPYDRLMLFFGDLFRVGIIKPCDISLDPAACSGCRICERICPQACITVRNGNAAIGTECYGCIACVNACPSVALHLRGEKDSRHRYRHPDTRIADLLIRQ